MTVRVVHVGNNPDGSGGIASVIRGRLTASADGGAQDASSICSYDQDARSTIKRNWPAVRALREIVKTQAPCVLHFHVSQRGSLLREGLLMALGRVLPRRAVLVTLHGSSLARPDPLSKCVIRLLATHITDLVHVLDTMYVKTLDIDDTRAVALPNHVAVPSQRSGLRKTDQIAFVGEVGHRKGVDVLLKAWSSISHGTWKLVIVGPVTDAGRQFLSAYRDVPDWEAVGPVPGPTAWSIMASSKILVQPSRAETFPMSVCEAMAHECAVVGTAVGGLGPLLRDAHQVVIAVNDAQVLAVELASLMANADRCATLGVAARTYARQSLDARLVENRWSELYSGLIGELVLPRIDNGARSDL